MGRRLTVWNVVAICWASTRGEGDIADYELSQEQAEAALRYCDELRCLDEKLAAFCCNCALDSWYPADTLPKALAQRLAQTRDPELLRSLVPDELIDEPLGTGWTTAAELLHHRK